MVLPLGCNSQGTEVSVWSEAASAVFRLPGNPWPLVTDEREMTRKEKKEVGIWRVLCKVEVAFMWTVTFAQIIDLGAWSPWLYSL